MWIWSICQAANDGTEKPQLNRTFPFILGYCHLWTPLDFGSSIFTEKPRCCQLFLTEESIIVGVTEKFASNSWLVHSLGKPPVADQNCTALNLVQITTGYEHLCLHSQFSTGGCRNIYDIHAKTCWKPHGSYQIWWFPAIFLANPMGFGPYLPEALSHENSSRRSLPERMLAWQEIQARDFHNFWFFES